MVTFPYHPTRVLSSASTNGLIYIFQPLPESKEQQLLALNTSSTISNTNLPYSTITPQLPFLDEDESSYTPVIDEQGNMYAYAGSCINGPQGSGIWQLEDPAMSLRGNATWQELELSKDKLGGGTPLAGANLLASGIAFADTLNATAGVYIFGGMCPNSTASTAANWQQAANYSNAMLSIEPIQQSSSVFTTFELNKSPSRGPPVAEAGFSITPLNPTFSSSTDGQSQSQNQNFVLLGGHTQVAFINMSQVALFSLPEQSWTFLPVDLPSDMPDTDLAIRQTTNIDSRSGHSAVLSLDGSKIIVFGGWVGDISQLAEPQLIVLDVGQGYGGSGQWQWTIPKQAGPSLAPGTGIYGHGAVMLEGDVMMIVGGYQISSSSISRWRRQSLTSNSQTLFFNTTSNTWISSYTRPIFDQATGQVKGTGGDNSAAKKAGLGAGLTFGILAILMLLIFYFWYTKRLKRKREARDEELRNLAAGAHRFQLSGPNATQNNEMASVPGHDNPWNNPVPPPPGGRGPPEAERTGLLFEIPSPTRGLRRSLHSRGAYQPAPRFENGRRTPDFSTIHPIDERDEYDEGVTRDHGEDEMLQRRDFDVLSNVPVLNPFQYPNERSRSPSPQSPQERELEVRRWVSDWTAADALMHNQAGRSSPEKTDRTSSTLSDQSARSMLSASSMPYSHGTLSRTMSQRSAALFSVAPHRSTNNTTPFDMQGSQSGHHTRPEHRRSQSLTLHATEERPIETPTTFATARTSFSHSQSQGESEALLEDHPSDDFPTSTKSRARGWMGSVRRVFTGERSASTSPEHAGSSSSSPIKSAYTDSGLPRRAASTGAMLWQKRQGAKDWDIEGGPSPGEGVSSGENDEWDVESAVERRVVQVMFTVPKEKLRVVNQGPEGDGESILSTAKEERADATEQEDVPSTSKGKEKEK